jgi:Sec-independent protein translocase protein TatA
MNFLGMGPMEILLILGLAFIFLGPERMVEASKMLGKLVREGRKLASELPRVVLEDDEIKLIDNKDDGIPRPTRKPSIPQPYTPPEDASDSQPISDGPVAHQPDRPSPPVPDKAPDEPPKT